LLIYKHTNLAEVFQGEQWPNSWTIPESVDNLDLSRIPRDQQSSFRKLDGAETSFAGMLDSIGKSKRYSILSYQAWRQPGLDKNNAVNIQINAGQTYLQQTRLSPLDDGQQTVTLFVQQAQLDNALTAVNNPDPRIPLTLKYRPVDKNDGIGSSQLVYELQGNIKIILSRFLHFYTDLLLMEPVRVTAVGSRPAGTALTISENNDDLLTGNDRPKFKLELVDHGNTFTTLHGFNIREHRRMRSEELHYIDHPLIGMIIKVTPVKNAK
jgi:hypothetical protein